jgi:hypothetical protein
MGRGGTGPCIFHHGTTWRWLRPGPFNPGKRGLPLPVPLTRRLRRNQDCCGLSGKEQYFFFLPRIERRFVGRPAHSLVTTPTTLRGIWNMHSACYNGILPQMGNFLIRRHLVDSSPTLCCIMLCQPRNMKCAPSCTCLLQGSLVSY